MLVMVVQVQRDKRESEHNPLLNALATLILVFFKYL